MRIHLFRIPNHLHGTRIARLPTQLCTLNRILTGCGTDCQAEIGKDLKTIHLLGVVIGGPSQMADNCRINRDVTSGYRYSAATKKVTYWAKALRKRGEIIGLYSEIENEPGELLVGTNWPIHWPLVMKGRNIGKDRAVLKV